MTAATTPDELRRVDLFADLDEATLAELARRAQEHHLAAGDYLWREGDPPDAFFVMLSGRLEVSRMAGSERVVFSYAEPVTYMGTMMLLTDEPQPVTARAVADTRGLRFDREAFAWLLQEHPSLLRDLARNFRPVYGRVDAAIAQRDKLASLGRLSAGLAHEINNPAAAAVRQAAELRGTLARLLDAASALAPGPATAAAIALADELAGREPPRGLALADREEALGARLDALGAADAWQAGAALAAAGADEGALDRLAGTAGAGAGDAASLAAAIVDARGLADDLADAAGRISGLVAAVKRYTYLDQAPTQVVDVHEGLESTLKMLAHAARRAGTTIERRYDRSLPRITAYGSELNQVWTNLLDNAIEAAGSGTVTVTTGRAADGVRVEIADDGPGIPPEAVDRIFEPFYTTKDVGEGTGLGLEVAHRIVVARHGGTIDVRSRPGDTRFEVMLPPEPPAA